MSFFSHKLKPHLLLMGLSAASLSSVLLTGCSGPDEVTELEEELEAARLFMNSLNYAEAAKVYEVIYPELPQEDEHWPETAFGYASALWHKTPPSAELVDQARGIFESLMEAYPGTSWAGASALSIARIEMLRDFPGDEENPEGAKPILRELLELGDTPVAHEALLRLAECYQMDFESPESLEAARDLMVDWLAEYPENPYAASMWEQVAWIELLDFDRQRPALKAFQEAEKRGFADPSRLGVLLWRMAAIARDIGEYEEAVRVYQKIITDAPTSGRAYEAQNALREIRQTVPGMEGIHVPILDLFN